jgi:alkylation response protein AidB-like acyl-CoA dehydrogenase
MLGNFDIIDGEQRRRAPDGSVVLRRGFFPTSECSIIDTWDMTGMRGTGSHDWTVTEQFIPQHRTVEVPGRLTLNQWSRWRGPFYALPVHALIGPHHSVIATGIARAAIDALTELAGAKVPRGRQGLLRDQPHIQDAVARAEGILGAGQAYRQVVASDIWATVAAGQETTLEQRARCRLAASFAAGDGPDVPRGRHHLVQTDAPAGPLLAGPPGRWPGGQRRARMVRPERQSTPGVGAWAKAHLARGAGGRRHRWPASTGRSVVRP